MVTKVAALSPSAVGALTGWWLQQKRRPARYRPAYLDMCTSNEQNGGLTASHLAKCSIRWRGKPGEDNPKRPIGCGDRVLCSMCADYYGATQAREAIAIIETIMDECERRGWESESAGDAITFTLPASLSQALDMTIGVDAEYGRKLINKLRQAAWRCIKKAYAKACQDAGLLEPQELAGVMVFHWWGSSTPWEPNYHLHVYVPPWSLGPTEWEDDDGRVQVEDDVPDGRKLPKWWSKAALELLRRSWKKAAQRILGMKHSGEWDVHRSWLPNRSAASKYIAYQLRAPMKDCGTPFVAIEH